MGIGTWVNSFVSLLEHTRAKAVSINDRVNGLSSNFDKIPLPRDDGEKGFFEPCAIGDGTEDFQASSVKQVRDNELNFAPDTGPDLGGIVVDHILTLDVAPSAYVDGLRIMFKAVGASNGAENTVNVNGLGVVPFYTSVGVAPSSGAIRIGDIVEAIYSSSGEFRMLTPWEDSTGRGEMPTGGNGDEVFYENGQNVTGDYTITPGTNALSAGPVTIDPGVNVTIPSGSTWVVV